MCRWCRCPRRPFLRAVILIVIPFIFFHHASAQSQVLVEFKRAEVPFSLKHEDRIVEKGLCDLILMKNLPNTFMLRIKGRGKSSILISGGEKIDYPMQGSALALEKDPDVPKFAKLTMKKAPEENVLYIIIETGKRTKSSPYHKIRFKLEYLE